MNQSFFKRPAFWYGIYFGIASILTFAIIYAVNFEFFGHFFMWMFISVATLATFMVLGGIAERKAQGGFLKYGNTFFTMFIIGMIGSAVSLLFTIIFANFIDTNFYTDLCRVMKESTMEFMESFDNIPEKEIDKAMDNMDKQFAAANTVSAYLKTFFINSGLSSLIVGLLCALFVKRNPPEGFVESTVLDAEN